MPIFSAKNISRFKSVINGAILRVMIAFSNVVISLFIIKTQSAHLWGTVVSYLILLDTGFIIINWGSAIYLIREFSNKPGQIKSTFIISVASRSILLGIFIVVLIFIADDNYKYLLIAWSVARFVYQSFDPLIQLERKFMFSIALEIIGIVVILLPIYFLWLDPTVINVIALFAISFSIRATALVFYNTNFLFAEQISLSLLNVKNYLLVAFPFFLLTVSGMFQQRSDLYCVALFLDPLNTAHYQIFLNLLILSQLLASLLLSPFLKNILRLEHAALRLLEKKFIIAGHLLTLLFVPLMYLVLHYIYAFKLPWQMYLMGYFYMTLFYAHLIRYYEMGKLNKQKTATLYSFLGCLVNIILSMLMTPIFGIKGALFAGLMTQGFMVLLYFKSDILKWITQKL